MEPAGSVDSRSEGGGDCDDDDEAFAIHRKLLLRGNRRWRDRARIAGRQALPKNIECGMDSLRQAGVAKKRPNQECAEDSLAKDVGEFAGGEGAGEVAALLAELHDLREKPVGASMIFAH